MNFPTELTQMYFDKFINRRDVYSRQGWNTTDVWYRKISESVTLEVIDRHLFGQLTMAIYALSDGHCKWCCWDCDDDRPVLDALQTLLTMHGWHVLREGRRQGRAGHLWMFFNTPVPAEGLIRFARLFERKAGIEAGTLEFFPKQSRAPYGSQVRAPLGIHHKPGAGNVRGWFDGVDHEVEHQLKWLASQPVNCASDMMRISDELKLREPIRIVQPCSKLSGPGKRKAFSNILDLIPESQRTPRGKTWITQCPACALQGWDRHRDNLHITLDGSNFWCVEGGPGKIHSKKDIRSAFGGKR